MNSSKINNWLTLMANLAVVAGIVFLTIQLRQNNDLLRSESRQALVANDVTSLIANLENAAVFARLTSSGELSAEEQLRLSFMFAIDLRNREFEYFQYTNGLLDEESWLAYRNVILINHSTGLGRSGGTTSDVESSIPNSLPRWMRCWPRRSQTKRIGGWRLGRTNETQA